MEVKSDKGEATEGQAAADYPIVRNAADALELLGIRERRKGHV